MRKVALITRKGAIALIIESDTLAAALKLQYQEQLSVCHLAIIIIRYYMYYYSIA